MAIINPARIRLVESDDHVVQVLYYTTDESFSHEFGLQHMTGYEVYKVKVWVDIMQEYIDVTLNYNSISKFVESLVDRDMAIQEAV